MRAWLFFPCLLGVATGSAGAQVPGSSAPGCEVAISPSDTEFGRIVAVAPGPDGRLAWTDGRSGQFAIRDARGRTRTIGWPGSGPGEFQYVGAMDWTGDSIWVGDGRLPRVQTFSDTGRLLRVTTALTPAGWGAVARDSLVGLGSVPLGRDVPFTVLSYVQGATRVDTVATFDLVPAERFPLPPAMAPNKQPLMPETVVGSSPSHQRFCAARPAEEDAVELQCVDRRGRVVLERKIRLEPRPLSDAVYDATIKRFVRSPVRTEAVVRDLVRRPRNLPLVMALMVTNDGGVWLRRTHDTESRDVWARLGPDGTPRDVVTPSTGLRVLRADSGAYWATSSDSDGLQTVHRCPIRSG